MSSEKKSVFYPNLSAKQQEAVIYMARGFSIAETAQKVSTSEQSIYNWKAEAAFQKALKAETMTHLSDCRRRLGTLAMVAIETMADLLDSDNPNVRLKTAISILTANGLETLDQEKYLMMGLGIGSFK